LSQLGESYSGKRKTLRNEYKGNYGKELKTPGNKEQKTGSKAVRDEI